MANFTKFWTSETMIWSFLLLCLHISSSFAYKEEMDPTAMTTTGRVVGINMSSRKNRTFSAFRGIPYAKPPIGSLRFKEPKEPEPWNHTLHANKDAHKCAQKNYLFGNQLVEGSEDCLYINVYTPVLLQMWENYLWLPVQFDGAPAYFAKEKFPNTSPDLTTKLELQKHPRKRLPVMVFIHWGGFFSGSGGSDYLGPEYLMDKDVVLVTFNYRLGVLGFFSTYDDASPGNFGLKDQNMALRWIQKNIKHFGGNKHNVTLFGQSAGGASVHYHMLGRTARDLFQRAISESGTALALWAQPIDPEIGKEIFQIHAKLVGCGGTIANSSALVECMRKVPVETLLKTGDSFKFFSVDPLSIYQPVVETKTHMNPNPFLTKHPLDHILDGNFMRIPWIVGLASDDGLVRSSALWSQEEVWSALATRFDELMPKMMALDLSVHNKSIEWIWKKIKNFYFTDKEGEYNNRYDIMRGLTDLYSDRSFHYSTYQSTLLHSKMGHKPIWFFNFRYTGQHSYKSLFSGVNDTDTNYTYSASHCDELLYLFKSSAFFPALMNSNDQKMIDTMVEIWTNFAINRNASPTASHMKWDPISNWKEQENYEIMKNINYLDIDGIYSNDSSLSFQMKSGIHNDRLQFWEKLPLSENIQALDQNHLNS